MDSGSISSTKLGYWSICVISGIPYDDLAASAGLEPATLALTGRCSGQLELRSHMVSRAGLEPARFSVVGLRPTAIAAMPPAGKMVGVERFELSANWSQSRRSSQTELRPDNGVTDGA